MNFKKLFSLPVLIGAGAIYYFYNASQKKAPPVVSGPSVDEQVQAKLTGAGLASGMALAAVSVMTPAEKQSVLSNPANAVLMVRQLQSELI